MKRLTILLWILVIPTAAAGQPVPAPPFNNAWAQPVDPLSLIRFEIPPSVLAPALRPATVPLLRPEPRDDRLSRVRFDVPPPIVLVSAVPQDQPPATPRPVAVEYSRGYEIRKRIHVVASLATLPLLGTEVVLGQSLYDGRAGSGTRSAHGAVAGAIAAVFGINTVTGAWNLWEDRKNPAGRGRRVTHAVLMMAANAGFVATASLAPESEEGEISGNRSQHRAVALTSIGLAATSYLIMLFGR